MDDEAWSPFMLAFDYRKKTPAAPGTWVLLIEGVAPEHVDLFQDYLKEERLARIYVIAGIHQEVLSKTLRDFFDAIIGEPEH
jgi:hypothetical protein